MTPLGRFFVAASGLCGASGVALAAYATHGEAASLAIAANFLMLHAPLFFVIGILGAARGFNRAGIVLLLGLTFFALDLSMRGFGLPRLLPSAAPLGCIMMIFGWLGIALTAVLMHRSSA